jgi:hypothetical protein
MLLPRETKVSLVWFAFAVTVVPVYFFAFSRFRVVLAPANIDSVPPMQALNQTAVYRNATMASASCTQACGVGGTCLQNDFGTVLKCTQCATGSLADGARCISTTSQCTSTPWCSSYEAAGAIRLDAALLLVNGTQVANSSAYAEIKMDLGDMNLSEALVLLTERRQSENQSTLSPTRWFNDEAGWWGASLPAYLHDLPPSLAPYTTDIKRRMCTQTWRDSGKGACVPP